MADALHRRLAISQTSRDSGSTYRRYSRFPEVSKLIATRDSPLSLSGISRTVLLGGSPKFFVDRFPSISFSWLARPNERWSRVARSRSASKRTKIAHSSSTTPESCRCAFPNSSEVSDDMAAANESPSVNKNGRVIQLADDLAERIGDLLFDDKTADVTLIVEEELLPAHRAILCTSCEYFRALLQGKMKESLQNEITLEDVPLRGFKLLMSYIYTGQLRVDELDDDTLVEVLHIAHMYGIAKLETSLSEHLQENLTLENVFAIYSKTYDLQLEELGEACYRFMIQDPEATVESDEFCELSEAALCHVLSQDTFHAEEIKIFEAVLRWQEDCDSEQDLADVLDKIRLPLIDTKHLLTTVKDSGLISMELLMDAIKTKECDPARRNFRGALVEDKNLATAGFGAFKLIARTRGNYLAPRARPEYDRAEMPRYDTGTSFSPDLHFTLALREPFFANHIGFEISNRTCRCGYSVDVSVDLINWVRVIDRSQYSCGSFQDLHFKSRVVRYVQLTCGQSQQRRMMIPFKKLVVNYITEPHHHSLGFLVPEENVASSARGAIVLSKMNASQSLIDDENTIAEDGVEWTSHKIGHGSIEIQLAQPYTVDSMRMLLRSDESRAYEYYVETSLDRETWTRVADRTTGLCRSWQELTFKALPVLYINIVGTTSTVDTEFTCRRFECPFVRRGSARSSEEGDGDDNVPAKRQRSA